MSLFLSIAYTQRMPERLAHSEAAGSTPTRLPSAAARRSHPVRAAVIRHVIARQGKGTDSLHQLHLKDDETPITECCLRTGKVEYPHPAEPFVANGGSLVPIRDPIWRRPLLRVPGRKGKQIVDLGELGRTFREGTGFFWGAELMQKSPDEPELTTRAACVISVAVLLASAILFVAIAFLLSA